MNTDGLITIKQVVEEYMMTSDLPEIARQKVFQGAIRGYTYLNLRHLRHGKVVTKLEMTDNDIVTLPSDYVSFIKLGVPFRGKFWTLTEDSGIITTTTESGGAETLDPDYGEGEEINHIPIDYYGKPGGYNVEGYYKLDEPNWRIVFRNIDRTEVLLEYRSSGISLQHETYIPVKAIEALHAYIYWYLIVNNRRESRNEKEAAEQAFLRRCQDVKLLDLPTLDQIRDVWNRNINAGLRK